MTTSSIGTASRNYSTISAWWTAWAAGGWTGQCYNDSEFTTSGTISFSGQTGTSANYTTLQTGPGQSFRDNAGASTNALTYNVSNGVGIRKTANYNSTFSFSVSYFTIQYLQISGGSDGYAIAPSGAFSNFLADSCIMTASQSGNPVAYVQGITGGTIRNCVLIQTSAGGRGLKGGTGIIAQDCTIMVGSNLTSTANGIEQNYSGTYSITGCSVFGFTAWGDATYSYTGDYNATTNSTGPPGSHSLTSVIFANQLIGTTSTAPDCREQTGASTIGAGTAISGITTDIIGTARGATPDIGAWQNPGSPPPTYIVIPHGAILNHYISR